MSPPEARSFHFPGWELLPQERLLRVRGEPVKIGGRAFDLLLALAERQGRVVTKGELLEAAWPGLVVEENNLSVQITTLRKLLGAQAIATVSGLGYKLVCSARSELTAAPAAPAAATHPWPVPPQLFGRETDLLALVEHAGTAPLVSIVGTGGVGKTSLAAAVLSRSRKSWRDGVHWIDLSPLPRGSPFMPLVAKALTVALDGFVEGIEAFIASLGGLQALIVVDNCEHLLDEVGRFVEPALRLAPGIRWLVTSQVPLHVQGEVVHRLEPLRVPAPDAAWPAAIDQHSALALFVERARSADRHFELTARNLSMAVEVCRQLDGLPLAIEMAAARVVTLGVQGVRDQLGQRLRLLAAARHAPARHRTLLQTFDWSYGLLAGAEQRVFRRLEPFLGGFVTDLAQQVCSGAPGPDALQPWEVLEALGALVDKSLVQRSTGTVDRFYLLESAREYAAIRLDDAGEHAEVQSRHANVIADLFDAAHDDFAEQRDAEWIERYLPERHNLRAALVWACRTREPGLLARLVAALAQLDVLTQTQAEVLQCDIPMDVLAAAPLPQRARAYLEFGWAHYLDGKRDTGTELTERALADFESTGDAAGTYLALSRLVRLYESRPGLLERACALAERLRHLDDRTLPLRSLLTCAITSSFQYSGHTVARLRELHEVARRSGFDALAATCRIHITDELLIQGNFDEAAQTARTMLEQDEPRPRARGLICHNQALALMQLGRDQEAGVAARATLRALPSAAHLVVDLFALLAARQGRSVDAALMAGYGARVKRDRDLSSDPAEAAVIAETLCRLGESLGAGRLAELCRLGAAMQEVDILKMALPAVPGVVSATAGSSSA